MNAEIFAVIEYDCEATFLVIDTETFRDARTQTIADIVLVEISPVVSEDDVLERFKVRIVRENPIV